MSDTGSATSVQFSTAIPQPSWEEHCYIVMAPVKIIPGEKFDIIIGSELLPHDEGDSLCVIRRECTVNRINGPTRVDYTKGSYLFNDLSFAGISTHPRRSWVTFF